jgi:hypothetical protein
MGVVSMGVVSMGVVSMGVVSMGVVSMGVVSMEHGFHRLDTDLKGFFRAGYRYAVSICGVDMRCRYAVSLEHGFEGLDTDLKGFFFESDVDIPLFDITLGKILFDPCLILQIRVPATSRVDITPAHLK